MAHGGRRLRPPFVVPGLQYGGFSPEHEGVPMSAQPNLGMQVTTFENPMGINGFEFVEFAAPPGQGPRMRDYLAKLGFTAVAKHRDRDITLFRQGTINFLLNESPDSFASDF